MYAAGGFAVGVLAHHQALGEGELVSGLAWCDVQVDVEDALEGRLAVVDDDVVAVGVQSGQPGRSCDPLTDLHHAGDGLRRCVGQIDVVVLRDHQGMAADDRADVEDGDVVGVLMDPDRGCGAVHDGAEHAGHPVTVPSGSYAATMDSIELAFAGAAEQARLLAAGTVTAPSLTELYLERIARLDRELRSYRVVFADSARKAPRLRIDPPQRRRHGSKQMPASGCHCWAYRSPSRTTSTSPAR